MVNVLYKAVGVLPWLATKMNLDHTLCHDVVLHCIVLCLVDDVLILDKIFIRFYGKTG